MNGMCFLSFGPSIFLFFFFVKYPAPSLSHAILACDEGHGRHGTFLILRQRKKREMTLSRVIFVQAQCLG
jgi:hypothetical protein